MLHRGDTFERVRRQRGFPPAIVAAVAALVLLGACTAAEPPSATTSSTGPAPTRTPPGGTSTPPGGADRIDPDAPPGRVLSRIGGVPVLNYHQIRPWKPGDSESSRAYIMPPETFREQMRYLDRNGYTPISPDQLLAHLTTGAKLPAQPVLLTFDDAVDDHATQVLPVLQRHGFTATFFIMTVVLGNEGYLTEDQLRTLDEAGMTLGLHTWDHHRVDRYSGDDWTEQIVEPTRNLERILGHDLRYFAYPYGAWDGAAFPRLRDNGYWAAFQLTGEPVSEQGPLYTLQRTIASPYWDLEEFAATLTTLTSQTSSGATGN